MKPIYVIAIVIFIPLLIALLWALSIGGIGLSKDLNKRQADANRDVYQHNASYVLGKQQIIGKYLAEYRLAKTEDDRAALRSVINSELATVDRANLAPDIDKNLKQEGF